MGGRGIRTKGAWVLAVPFFVVARPTPGPLAVGVVLAALGLALRGWAAGTIQKEVWLATGGPYAFTRNPLYLGSLLIGTGMTLGGGHWVWPAIFLAFFAGVYRRAMAEEGRHLREIFGERYDAYTTAVPALVPRLTPYAPEKVHGIDDAAADGFRWSRYLRNREWEALLGTLAAFTLLGWKLV